MSGVEIDSKVFYARTKRLFSKWAVRSSNSDAISHDSKLTLYCHLCCFSGMPRLLRYLQEADKDADLEGLRGVDGLAVIVGDAEEDLTPKKGVAVQVSSRGLPKLVANGL
jgi:hypothetical protein